MVEFVCFAQLCLKGGSFFVDGAGVVAFWLNAYIGRGVLGE